MDASTQAWLMPVIVFAFGLFAAGMYLYRKYTAGESFEATKFLQTLGLGGLAALVLYFASAAIPDVDSVITYIETLAPGGVPSMSVILAALLAVWNGISKKTTTSTISTATEQAATTEQTKSSLATSASVPKASILGIYGGSASGGVPTASVTCDVNQVPELFFDIQTLVTGKLMVAMKIDGTDLKDWGESNLKLNTVGEKLPLAFWIPQKFRVSGTHIITINLGHAEEVPLSASPADPNVIWDSSQDFALILTGTKPRE